MWKGYDDQILDAIAGRIDAPCEWRLQFWVLMAFARWSVVMLEGDKNCAVVYLWILSLEQSNVLYAQRSVSGLNAAPFDLEDVRELSPAQANYWRHWPFFRIGDVMEKVEEQMRDGIVMTMRSLDGVATHHADLTNPDEKLQPLRSQARSEVFELLSQIWDWQTLMDSSNLVEHRK